MPKHQLSWPRRKLTCDPRQPLTIRFRDVTINPDLRMEAAIFDDLTTLADATRSRMLLLLERHELTVAELCAVLQLPQSTVSRHLKTLADAGWVTSRRDGTSRYYTLRSTSATHATPAAVGAAARAGRRHVGRRSGRAPAEERAGAPADGSQEFFASAAGQWDQLREELFGGASHLQALPGLLDEQLDRRRSRLRHRAGRGGARAVRRARDRGRSLGRHAAGGAAAAARAAPTSRSGAASSKRCRSTTASSTPRR